jgi:hypothetical protein
MTRHFSAVRLPLRSKFAAKLPQIPHLSKPRRREASARIKNGLKSPACKFLIPVWPSRLWFSAPQHATRP